MDVLMPRRQDAESAMTKEVISTEHAEITESQQGGWICTCKEFQSAESFCVLCVASDS